MIESEKLCRKIIKGCVDREIETFTSWFEFAELETLGILPVEDNAQGKRLRAVAFGKSKGWLTAEWCGVGLTPWAGSARRQRNYFITEKGKKEVSFGNGEQKR